MQLKMLVNKTNIGGEFQGGDLAWEKKQKIPSAGYFTLNLKNYIGHSNYRKINNLIMQI